MRESGRRKERKECGRESASLVFQTGTGRKTCGLDRRSCATIPAEIRYQQLFSRQPSTFHESRNNLVEGRRRRPQLPPSRMGNRASFALLTASHQQRSNNERNDRARPAIGNYELRQVCDGTRRGERGKRCQRILRVNTVLALDSDDG